MIERIAASLDDLVKLTAAGPVAGLSEAAKPLLDRLLSGVEGPEAPRSLLTADNAAAEDYLSNWNHQLWYHLGELVRVHRGEKQRAEAQGGDSWANQPKPEPEVELANQLRELAKLQTLMNNVLRLVKGSESEVLFDDAGLSDAGTWEHPKELEVERDAEKGVRWRGQNPGGDWFWLTKPLPDEAVSIRFDLYPVDTVKGGLITAFCVKPLDASTPLRTASSPRMSDYYKNFDAYHFSINRGSSGYCNLRRSGPGLIMLASFPDPCPEYGRWYAVEIVKAGPQVELRVDGKLAVCYVDLGLILPALEGGYFGLRHFQGFNGWHRNVRITTLKA